jgi:hypothetical protein
MRLLAVALLALASAAAPAAAQESRTLHIGAPIRLAGFGIPGGAITGMLAGVAGDTILVGVTGGIVAERIPRAAVTHLYLLVGRKSGAGRAARVGMFVGLAAGAGVAFAERNRLTTPSIFIALGGAGGAMIGGAVGQFIFREPRWTEAPLAWLDALVEGR